ncbi:MAG: hypothetical protein FWE74_06350 [Oscillospiraceae bacterium]|nr:hypothetical protein [Oscillospiraceae bacterium]
MKKGLRAYPTIRRVQIGEWIFRQTRQFFGEYPLIFKKKLTQYDGKYAVKMYVDYCWIGS